MSKNTGTAGRIAGLSAVLLVTVLVISSMILPAAAAEQIDTGKPVSLAVTLKSSGNGIKGVEFSLYRVADVSQNAEFTACGDFKDYPGRINGLSNTEEWDVLADDIREYIQLKNITAVSRLKTDGSGVLKFGTDGKLMPGLYLLTCGTVTVDKTEYTANPCLICLPDRSENGGEWEYDASVYPKPGENVKPVTPPGNDPKNPSSDKPGGKLPQTGMLVWPAAVLIASGLFCVLIGMLIRGRKCRAS